MSRLNFSNLAKLAVINKTDKGNQHGYIVHYEKHFSGLRNKKLNILEIGAGGYEDSASGGNSLRMWKHYFPKSIIYAIDIHDKRLIQEERIRIFKGSQADGEFLRGIFKKIGSLDIIIDDGSHVNEHIITTFKVLFPLLKSGGVYVVEDLQTSYWPDYGGDTKNLNNSSTAINFFKSLADCLNHEEFRIPEYQASYFDKNISALHFYRNLAFIYKA